jgi:pimeloyl-ACP methyl ester carboxylesterase
MNGRNNGVWDLLPEITAPVVLVIGEADEPGPASTGEEMARRLPNATFRHIPHLDHFAPFTHPGEMSAIVADAVTPPRVP